MDPLSFYLDKSDPQAWKAVVTLSQAATASVRDAGLDDQLIELVNIRVSQINGCGYCLHVHVPKALEAGVSDQRLGLVAAWRESEQIFSAEERAALALAEAVTTLPRQEDLHVTQVMSADALTDAQYSAVQWLAMTMNLTNRISILSHHPVKASDYTAKER